MIKFLAALLFLTQAHGAISEMDKSISAPRNLLSNPGFEAGKAGWTASGGTFVTTSTAANKYLGNSAGSWDSSSASQTLTSNSVTVTSAGGLSSANITGGCYFKVAGAYTGKVQLFDGTNVLSEATITNNTAGFTPTYVTGAAPVSGTVSLRVISVASNEPIVYSDDCYLGRADGFNLFQVSQASIVGTINWANTASCSWATTSASFANFSADSDCPTPTVTGALSAPATKIPGFDYNNMPTGDYMFVATGSCNTNSTTGQAALQYSDGTNTFGNTQFSGTSVCSGAVIGRFNYNTSGSRSFQFQGRITAGTLNIENDSNAESLTITVYRFPTSSETAARVDALPASWSGFHSGVSGGCTTTSSTYADTSACTGSLILNERQNRNFGTVTTIGSSLLGITFTPPRVGRFLVQASVTTAGSVASGMSGRIIETGSSQVIGQSYVQTSSVNIGGMQHVIGILNVTSLSSVSLKWQFATNGGTLTAQTNPISAIDQASWSIVALDQSFPAPVLVSPNCSVRLDTGNGYGATGTAIRRYTNSSVVGNCIAYADSSNSGMSFTINTAGVYTIDWSAKRSASSANIGISMNASSLTTTPDALTVANGNLGYKTIAGSTGDFGNISKTKYFNAGDVIRVFANANVANDALEIVNITRVGN
jgi:hypothetical protein